MIIGLTGASKVGKDTVAAYLIKEHKFERRSIADPIKRSVANLLGISYRSIEKWKNDPLVHVEVARYADEKAAQARDGNFAFVEGQTFRSFLDSYGRDASRDILGENVWLDLTLPEDGYYTSKNIVVTDIRFENESSRVRDCGGFVVKVTRPNTEPGETEASLPVRAVDYHLPNDSSLTMLYEETERMLYTLADSRWAAA